MTPSRSRMISFTWRVCGTGSEANWTKGALPLDGELRDIGDLIHRFGQAAQQRKPVGAQRGVLRHDQHVVEEAIDAGARGSQRAQSLGIFAAIDVPVHDRKELLHYREQVVLRAVGEERPVYSRRRLGTRFLQDVD